MIKNIIFDFGDIFINLDKEVVFREMDKYIKPLDMAELWALNNAFEVGQITTTEFLKGLQNSIGDVSIDELARIWNSMLLDFPDYRLDFLENLALKKTHRLFLLSNTNALHIPHVEKIMGTDRFMRFKNCFEGFYLSHEINLRKPNSDIFRYVLEKNKLLPTDTLFIDDTRENTDAAKALGIHTWHLIVGKEDIVDLNSKI